MQARENTNTTPAGARRRGLPWPAARLLAHWPLVLCLAAAFHAQPARADRMSARDQSLCRALPAQAFSPRRSIARDEDEFVRLIKTTDNTTRLRAALKRTNVNALRPPAQTTLLAIAASFGNVNAIEALLAQGAQRDQPTGTGETALEYAVLGGQAAAACALLRHGAALPSPAAKPYLLPVSALVGDFPSAVMLVDLLVGHGFDPNAQVNGDSALHIAAELGNTQLIALLAAKGADTTLRNAKGETALAVAQRMGERNAVEAMTVATASPPPVARRPATPSSPARCPAGPAEQAIDFSSETAMRQSIETLLAQQEAPRIVRALGKSQRPTLKRLLSEGENVNVCVLGNSILALSASGGDLEEVRWLVSAGAELDRPADPQGRTPLMAALAMGRHDIARYLLDRGADPLAATDSGTTTLQELAIGSWRLTTPQAARERRALAGELVAKGVPINARTNAGATALMSAVAAGDAGFVAQLLNLGADARLRSNRGLTATNLAERKQRNDLVQLLRQYGAAP